jgi:hypothetical protein
MRKIWLPCTLIPLALSSLLQAQEPIKQANYVAPAKGPALPRRDVSKLPEPAQPIYYSAASAAEWLKRANKPDGSFVYGFQPSLRVLIDGDNFVSQAGAVLSLARASRYLRDEGGTAKARQAILTLLLQTMPDPQNPRVRYTAAPPGAVNRLAGLGLLVSAIHELARPQECKDLLDQADQLCNYLREQQHADGSLFLSQGKELIKSGSVQVDAENAGLALQGIIRSNQQRPAAWKLDALRKARMFYAKAWQNDKSFALVVTHAPAYAEAFMQTKDAGYAETVFAMNDWLVGLQYREEFDSSRKHWNGGFPRIENGQPQAGAPDISSASAGESLAEACRVAKALGDLPRLQRYERALIANLHFVMSLQYNGPKTQHFVEAYRPSVLGAFHASHQDGNLKLDYTLHPLCAMVQYLDTVVE